MIELEFKKATFQDVLNPEIVDLVVEPRRHSIHGECVMFSYAGPEGKFGVLIPARDAIELLRTLEKYL